MESLRALLLGVAEFALDRGGEFISAFRYDAAFREGFCSAVFMIVFIGVLGHRLWRWSDGVRLFFQPVRVGPGGVGPRPIDMYKGCIRSSFKLGLFAVLVLIFMASLCAKGLE